MVYSIDDTMKKSVSQNCKKKKKKTKKSNILVLCRKPDRLSMFDTNLGLEECVPVHFSK